MFSGLVLQTMVQKNRQDFEMELQRIQEQYNYIVEEKEMTFSKTIYHNGPTLGNGKPDMR